MKLKALTGRIRDRYTDFKISRNTNIPPERMEDAMGTDWWPQFTAYWAHDQGTQNHLAFLEHVNTYRAAPDWAWCDYIVRVYLDTGAPQPVGVADSTVNAIRAAVAAAQRQEDPSAGWFDSCLAESGGVMTNLRRAYGTWFGQVGMAALNH